VAPAPRVFLPLSRSSRYDRLLLSEGMLEKHLIDPVGQESARKGHDRLRPVVFIRSLLVFPTDPQRTCAARHGWRDAAVFSLPITFGTRCACRESTPPGRAQVFGTKPKEHLDNLASGRNVVVDYSSGGRSQRIRGRMPMNNQAANLEQYEASRAWRGRRYHGDQATSHRIKYLVTRPS
jgi:hypothetical protein